MILSLMLAQSMPLDDVVGELLNPIDPLAPMAPMTSTPPTTGYYDDNGMWIPPSRDRAPDTDACPRSLVPPEPVSTSERVLDGATPTPLPPVYSGPCGVITPNGYQVDSEVVASAWLVADIDSGEVVAMKDPHGRYRPASIIKVLLALVAIDELDLDSKVIASPESASQEGSSAGIGEGGEYSVRDLLHGLILSSGNDAAHALAQELDGDEEALTKVNELARELGMADTRVTSYSGLDAAGMSTSAWDMGLAYREAFNNPVFAGIADTQTYEFPGFDELPPFEMWNDNKLYLEDPDGIGGKTGYTDDANHTFVGAVNHDGRRLVAIVLDTAAWDARPWQQAQMLLHAAYPIAPGSGVAQLAPVSAQTETSQPAPTPEATEPNPDADEAPDRETHWGWLPLAIIAAVAAFAGVGAWLARRSGSSSGRHAAPSRTRSQHPSGRYQR